jgi:hypothetical protein
MINTLGEGFVLGVYIFGAALGFICFGILFMFLNILFNRIYSLVGRMLR